MRKLTAVFLALILCFAFAGCATKENNDSNGLVVPEQTLEVEHETTLWNPYDEETQPTPQTPETVPDTKPHYISDRRVQYNEAQEQYILFFGLQTAQEKYTDASGTAKVVITDNSGTELYNQNLTFTAADFTDWTNQTWDSARYLCGLYIDKDEVDGSASSTGTLALTVELNDGTYFSEEKLYISDLPDLQVAIEVPSVPTSLADESYSYTSYLTVTKLEYSSTIYYDGTATVELSLVVRLDSKTAYTNRSDYVRVGYKLYDSDGVVVDSGQIYSDPITVGEASKCTQLLMDLDPRESYKLVFVNAT